MQWIQKAFVQPSTEFRGHDLSIFGYVGFSISQSLNFASKIRPFAASTKLPLHKSYVRHITMHVLSLA
jgi:hypothetical protein